MRDEGDKPAIRRKIFLVALLTKSTMPIVKWVAEVMGWLMNGIYSIGGHKPGPLHYFIYDYYLYVHDASADQTAEVL